MARIVAHQRCASRFPGVILAIAALILTAAGGCSARRSCFQNADAPSAPPGTIRVLTYNIFIANPDLAKTAESILKEEPDVAILQEVTREQFPILAAYLTTRLPYSFLPESPQHNVVALFSRLPLRDLSYEPSRDGLNGFVFAQLDWNDRPLQLAGIHLDPIRAWTCAYKLTLPFQLLHQGAVHQSELEQVFARLRPQTPTIIAGDFNSYASDAGTKFLEHRGFMDSLGAVCAEAAPTHHFNVLGLPFGGRIDFIFHDGSFRTVEGHIAPGEPSDHDLVTSSLEWAQH